MKLIKNILICILLGALVLPASASTIGSWTQTDISGYNLTLNYTSNFSVAKDDTLGITINNIGNESINDSITVTKINVSGTSIASGNWTGTLLIKPSSSNTTYFVLNMTTDDIANVNINIYYNVSSDLDNKVLVVGAHYPGAPDITSWSNNKTNNNNRSFTINESEGVKFNFTANQTLTSWLWTLNGANLFTPFDNLTRTFNNEGLYHIGAIGSNVNGSTQVIVWNVSVLDTEGKKRKNATIIYWSPQVVDYVNGTLNETIDYSITTSEEMTTYNWSVDGKPVSGNDDGGNTYSYSHNWNNSNVGAHTVSFKGNNSDTKVEFRWYVNVYKEGGRYIDGDFFEIIDDYFTDIKIRMFKYKIAKDNGKSDYAARKVNQLHDEIAKRQMTREALRNAYKAGNITIQQYVDTLKQVQLDAKYNSKLAEGYANVAKEHKDDESEKEFKKISEIEREGDRKKKEEKREVKEEKKDEKEYNSNNRGVQNSNNGQKQKGKGRD
jgi:hypothetical protein